MCTEISTLSKRSGNELDSWISQLEKKIKLPESKVKHLCKKAVELLGQEKNVIVVSTPVTACGDIHGQFEDLMYLFKKGGRIGQEKYLFLGDYVDRGEYSVECISLLFAYKIKYPNYVFLLRGNHECRSTSQVYGFYDECMRKYGGVTVWKNFTDAFDYLPLCALIDNRILCMHGGLSVKCLDIGEINMIDRVKEVPYRGLMTDLLWSDPDDETENWKASNRGAGIIFGPAITSLYTHFNNLAYICRAHQVVKEGYEWSQEKLCLTIFSAANYCSECRNQGAIMKLNRNSTNPIFKQYLGQTYPPSPDTGDAGSDLTTYNSRYFMA
ncbi:serine/threonine-protein phosphatase PP-X isozyme 2 [Diaphorina citri]|uniref:Serine/threonine-protein phosphatase n=1 Tax=Diaphorina citri TaxID=121845 RepID=A0A1S3CYD7_DIACI|nr:serine/threonine-protein phosphatase PP-X isozyme 2 [Diaphorina citri]KAI5713395.1 hypothetical protein M8J75_016089 [Diaphorina citri]KAI5750471.1 hypothetical protein M8J76_015859 [Diaphorina citri]KAI5756036.1 hypothetical protein M8J77_021529 [Diaphorina citri]